jgi:hypothetical protein
MIVKPLSETPFDETEAFLGHLRKVLEKECPCDSEEEAIGRAARLADGLKMVRKELVRRGEKQ